MDDRARLALLYSSMPENNEQHLRREELIKALELRLGIREQDSDAMVVNGDLDDASEGFKAKGRR